MQPATSGGLILDRQRETGCEQCALLAEEVVALRERVDALDALMRAVGAAARAALAGLPRQGPIVRSRFVIEVGPNDEPVSIEQWYGEDGFHAVATSGEELGCWDTAEEAVDGCKGALRAVADVLS